MKLPICAAALALMLAASSTAQAEQTTETPEQREAVVTKLEALGLRNIAGLHISDATAEGFATYQGERVRFLYNGANGYLNTYELKPPVP